MTNTPIVDCSDICRFDSYCGTALEVVLRDLVKKHTDILHANVHVQSHPPVYVCNHCQLLVNL